ncbi:MAG TPA: DUF2802 domain-containing protein [Ectothiorhodospiraceae bacterium]|nr:DUF2802 domain-containing protein [Ectothiorhodospiraceae bacterium]
MFELSWVNGISVAIAILIAIYLSVLLSRLRKRLNLQQQQIQSLQQDLRSLCSAAVNVGERLGGLERESSQLSREQKVLSQKQNQTTIKVTTAEESSFDQALKLAKKGASAEEMADICNVTRGEADLIAMMHRLESGE